MPDPFTTTAVAAVKETTLKTFIEQIIKFIGGRVSDLLEDVTGSLLGHKIYDAFHHSPEDAKRVATLINEGKFDEAEKLTRTVLRRFSLKDEQKMSAALLRAVRNGVAVTRGVVTEHDSADYWRWFRTQDEGLREFIKGFYDEYTDAEALAYDLAEAAMMTDAERENRYIGLRTRTPAERLEAEIAAGGAAAAAQNAVLRAEIAAKWARLTTDIPPLPATGSFAGIRNWFRTHFRLPACYRTPF